MHPWANQVFVVRVSGRNSWTLLGAGLGACLALSLLLATGCSSAPSRRSASDQERADAFLNLAVSALAAGDTIGALESLNDAERHTPKDPQIPYLRAVAKNLKRDIPGAIEQIKRAIELDPKFSDAHNFLGKLYIDSGQLPQAEKPLLLAASDELFRDAYKARTNLGILYYRQGKLDQAERQIDQAIALNPDQSCAAYYYRGHLRLRANQHKEAIQSYDRASRSACGGFTDAHLALAIAYERSKDFSRARKKLLDIAQIFPQSSAAEKALERLKRLP